MANTNETNSNGVLTEEGMNTLINKIVKKSDEKYLTMIQMQQEKINDLESRLSKLESMNQ